MKLKDLITVSLLGVVAFVLGVVTTPIMNALGTYGVFVHVSIGSFLCAPIFFVMCHRIPKRGSIFIFYTLQGIVYAIMGFAPMIPIMLLAGIVGEICVLGTGNYENNGRITVSYLLSQVIYALHGFFFILVLGVEGMTKTFPEMFTLESAQMLKDTFFAPKNMAIILTIEISLALLGTVLGKFVYNKYFNKSTKKEGILS